MRILALAVFAILVFVSGAAGQDYSLNPNYGTVSLSSGFMPDPYELAVHAGGSVDASAIPGCAGFISQAPDFRLRYTAGTGPLVISVISGADTTLVVSDPANEWRCDDNGGQETNPRIMLAQPASGQYDIWIGLSGSRNATQPARLVVTEIADR